MADPQRIQLSRVKGWRKPGGVVVVARPTKWGNPYRWQEYRKLSHDSEGEAFSVSPEARRRYAVIDFEAAVAYDIGGWPLGYPSREEIRHELAGCDLACWCPLDGPCHADVLMKIANTHALAGGA
jgi:hypothetical protein